MDFDQGELLSGRGWFELYKSYRWKLKKQKLGIVFLSEWMDLKCLFMDLIGWLVLDEHWLMEQIAHISVMLLFILNCKRGRFRAVKCVKACWAIAWAQKILLYAVPGEEGFYKSLDSKNANCDGSFEDQNIARSVGLIDKTY